MAPKRRRSKKKKIEEVILVKQRNNLTMKRRKRQKRPWSDLPADLLTDVMVRNYSPADQICFRAVCRNWQQQPIDHENAQSAIHEMNKLPWVVTADWTDNEEEEKSCVLTCKLFDPTHSNPYSVNKILFRDRRSNERTRICSSKHGWLLFEKKKHNNLTSFFLFSPFIQQFIHLPDLDNFIPGFKYTSTPATLTYATFSSSDPYNDPDCEFFVLRDCFYHDCNRITISTCRRGDQNWTTRVFDKQNQVFSIRKFWLVLYMEVGYLCCLSDLGSLVLYSVAEKDWIRLINPRTQVILFEGRPHLIECEGGLLLVMVRDGHHYHKGCSIFKFSWSSSNWNIVRSLPNQAIFVGPTASFLVPASWDIANKIYYYDLDTESLKFYCLKDRESRKYLRAAADDDDSLRRGWLAKGMLENGVTWIQSPK